MFSAIEKAGIICRSNLPWSSPLHMVQKKNRGWCPCGDYRRLNTVTIPDRYPLPNIADFSARVKGSTIFSKLNLQKGYYQVPMALRASARLPSSHCSACSNFWDFPLALRNAGTPSRDYWIPSSEIYPTVLLMWMISWCSAVTWILMWISLSSFFPLSSTKTHHRSKCEFAVDKIEFMQFSPHQAAHLWRNTQQ